MRVRAAVDAQGKGIETLGTVLAAGGWALAALALVGVVSLLREAPLIGDDIRFFVTVAASLLLCLALAGVGHLLRAAAQLGRNMHRLAAMLQQRAP